MYNNSGYHDEKELKKLGFKKIGDNVKLSKFARIYNPKNISIGDNVRIDDFCVLIGNIEIGSFVHIAQYCLLSGTYGIKIRNFVGLSARVSLFTNNEDYSDGKGICTAAVPEKFQWTEKGEIILDEHTLVGAHSIVLPNTHLKKGSIIGGLSLMKEKSEEWSLYVGTPAKKIKNIPKEEREALTKKLQDELENK
jgi:dTDP-4-amino-4,6-dideoxy-D-glucose acyltransferase